MWEGPPERMPQSLLSPNENDIQEEVYEETITFDRGLPGLHKYLGHDLIAIGGRTILEPDKETEMYAFYRSGVILVPGQTLPLIPYGPLESSLLLRLNKERIQLVFLPGCFDHVSSLDDFAGYIGTTADLAAIRIPDDIDEDATIHAMFVGRQRMQISKVIHTESYPLICHGRILPELSTDRAMAPHPLGWGLIPRSWARFGMDPIMLCPKSARSDSLSSVSTNGRTKLDNLHNRHPSRHSHGTTCSASSYHTASSSLASGNPMSIFDSRLSTWRNFGPVNTSSLSTRSSPQAQLDHFEGDSILEVPATTPAYASAPDLSSGRPHVSGHEFDTVQSDVEEHHLETSNPSPEDSITEDVELIMRRAVDRNGRPFRYRIRQPCHPRLLARRDVLAAVAGSFVPLPVWVYRQYDVNYLVTTIQSELLSWNDTWHVDRFSPDMAIPFSYWLIQNLPMSGLLKSRILEINHVVPRLRALLDVIQRSSACICSLCDGNITSTRYVICLAQEGSSQTYVNPSGVLHDILTVSQITRNSVVLVGYASEEYSWFPGYSWTIANCSNCSHHLGWLFTAVKEELRPRRFWGIRREAIVPGLMNEASNFHPAI